MHDHQDGARYQGIMPPIVTPLLPGGEVDAESLFTLTKWLLAEGVHGIWACGTNGEFACFTPEQRELIVRTCVQAAGGRAPVIACIADCSTAQVIEHGKRAIRAGADAVAVTPPYYYANSQGELLDLFRTVRREIDRPLFIYNIPSTVKVKVEVDTIVTLAKEETVAGIKDSQGDLDFIRSLVYELERKGAALRILLGTRSLIDAGMLVGAHGAIPGIANVVPRTCVEAYEAARGGDWNGARRAQARVALANRLVKTSGSPAAAGMGGIKAALKCLGIIAHSTLAAPLHSPTPEEEAQVATIARELGLLASAPAAGPAAV